MAGNQDAATEAAAAVETVVTIDAADVLEPDRVLHVLLPAFTELRDAVERMPQTPNVEAALHRLRDLVDISGR